MDEICRVLTIGDILPCLDIVLTPGASGICTARQLKCLVKGMHFINTEHGDTRMVGSRQGLSRSFKRPQKIFRALITILRTFCHRLFNHRVKLGSDNRIQPGRRRRIPMNSLMHDGNHTADEGALASQNQIQNDTGGIKICSAIDFMPHKLLRRHISWRAQNHAHLGMP